ncbi:MAG: cysteine desulfurase [Gammaproteobacteria bacterium]|nr:cysteine desulfurase [Gammaproteobacteria bacterium]
MNDIRNQFPILNQTIHGKPLVYLDSGASSQKPLCVIEAMNHYYQNQHANIHRGVYTLSQTATELFESARKRIQQFIHAKHAHEIIFVRGTTEAINLVAQSYGREHIQPGDEIILTVMEHHSNIVPWQLLAAEKKAEIKVVPLTPLGELDLDKYAALFSNRTRMVAVAHASNVLGTVNPIQKITEIAHAHGVPVLVDGAQAIAHLPVDVQQLGCDFYAFSSHKMYGPTGIGVLYGKADLLEKMSPWQGGGDMIERVRFSGTTFAKCPAKFEAGTPAIAEAIGLAKAVEWLEKIGMAHVQSHGQDLLAYAIECLNHFPGFSMLGNAPGKIGVLAFTLDNIHPHDIGTILDHAGIAIRAGHHCAMPLMEYYNVPACARASFGLYNTREDVDAFVVGLEQVSEVFA